MTGSQSFSDTARTLADHLRDPERAAPPAGVEERRLQIYRDLIYNNIESFIAKGFPVLRAIIDDEAWHRMVRDFVVRHRCHTPYFLEIGKEFLAYLQEVRQPEAGDFPFMAELAHYEWVELALDIADADLPPSRSDPNALTDTLKVSPLAWSLSYQYPVHHIGVDCLPEAPPPEPTFLVVYRNREDRVGFLEANAVTLRLMQYLEEGNTGRDALAALARELEHPDPAALEDFGRDLLEKLLSLDILYAPR